MCVHKFMDVHGVPGLDKQHDFKTMYYIICSRNYIFNIFSGLEFFLCYHVNGLNCSKITKIFNICVCVLTFIMAFHAFLCSPWTFFKFSQVSLCQCPFNALCYLSVWFLSFSFRTQPSEFRCLLCHLLTSWPESSFSEGLWHSFFFCKMGSDLSLMSYYVDDMFIPIKHFIE